MNRITILSLLIAFASAAPLVASAQTQASADDGTADDAAGAFLPQTAVSAASAAASSGDDDKAFEQRDAAERQRIANGRTAASAQYQQDRRACWQRFAVNDCLDQARERRRTTLDALRHDELILNAQERDRRTAARLNEIAQKQAANAQRKNSAEAPASSASEAQ